MEASLLSVQKIVQVRSVFYQLDDTQQRYPTKLINMKQVHETLPVQNKQRCKCNTQNKTLACIPTAFYPILVLHYGT